MFSSSFQKPFLIAFHIEGPTCTICFMIDKRLIIFFYHEAQCIKQTNIILKTVQVQACFHKSYFDVKSLLLLHYSWERQTENYLLFPSWSQPSWFCHFFPKKHRWPRLFIRFHFLTNGMILISFHIPERSASIWLRLEDGALRQW